MARKDKTFDAIDPLRIIANNLTRSEQNKVFLFLYLVIPEIARDRVEEVFLGVAVPSLGVPRTVISIAIRGLGILSTISSFFRQKIILAFYPSKERAMLIKIVEQLERSPFQTNRFFIRR